MQKKLIAVAIAGLMSGAAFAQSNVTISGLVDMGYTHASGNGMKANGINSGVNNGSRLSFDGAEKLGNGVTAVFKLEYGINPDINAGIGDTTKTAGNRQAYIGLAGNFGTVVAGKLKAPGDAIYAGYDSTDQSNSFSALTAVSGSYSTLSAVLGNAVAYVSPTMNGLTFVGAYSFAGASENDQVAYSSGQERIVGLRVSYDMGPLSLGFAHHSVSDFGGASSNLDVKENAIGGSYKLGAATLYGTWQKYKLNALSVKNTAYSLGATFDVNANDMVRAQYAHNNPNGSNDTSSAYSLRYDHNLSKRTMAYVGYTHVSNDNGAANTVATYGAGSLGVTGGDSSTGYGFGVQHTF
jgi:predicted porin